MLINDEKVIAQASQNEAQVELPQDFQVTEGGLFKDALQLCLSSLDLVL